MPTAELFSSFAAFLDRTAYLLVRGDLHLCRTWTQWPLRMSSTGGSPHVALPHQDRCNGSYRRRSAGMGVPGLMAMRRLWMAVWRICSYGFWRTDVECARYGASNVTRGYLERREKKCEDNRRSSPLHNSRASRHCLFGISEMNSHHTPWDTFGGWQDLSNTRLPCRALRK